MSNGVWVDVLYVREQFLLKSREQWHAYDNGSYVTFDLLHWEIFWQPISLSIPWQENDDEEPDPDDLNPYDRPKPKIDLSKLDTSDPEAMMKMTKRGQPIMMFVSVSGNPTRDETEKISSRWQEQLFNANFNFKRLVNSVGLPGNSLKSWFLNLEVPQGRTRTTSSLLGGWTRQFLGRLNTFLCNCASKEL